MNSNLFFPSENVEFRFGLPVDQAMQNLNAETNPPPQAHGGQLQSAVESLVGDVKRNSTYLYRLVPGSRNSFRPTFYGSFTGDETETVLRGEICLNKVIKKFIVLWCSIVALVAVFTLLTIIQNPAASWGSLLYVVCMLIACILFFRFMINKSSADTDWLKNEIQRAIDG